MKKITLFLAAAAMTFSAVAQNEIINRPNDNPAGTGLISTNGENDAGVFCADYFELTEDTAIGSVTFVGFPSNPAPLEPEMTGFSFAIYDNGGSGPFGQPGSGDAIIALDNIDVAGPGFEFVSDDGAAAVFQVNVTAANGDTQVVLPAGTYWVSGAPNVIGDSGGTGRWNWAGSSATPALEPVLIDQDDLFGAGATDWTNISGLIGEPFPSLAWSLIDEPIVLGVEDNLADFVSIYPNPANDVLNVEIPSNVEVTSASLVDVLGRNTGATMSNGTFNVSNLAQGVYILNIQTDRGSLVQKIVKQ